MALAECGTHAIFAAEIGRYAESEATLVGRLLDRLVPGMLLTADRGFFSYALGRKATATGAELLWRIRTDKAGPKPTHVADLPDGSWLAHLRLSTPASARREEPMLVRVPAHRAPQRVPDLALQEIWGHLCCHSAIRSLMTQAATLARPRSDQLRRRPADQPPDPRPPGRFPPLTHTAATVPDG